MTKPSLNLYNTETRSKEEIHPLDGKTIHLYTCGPTVYNYAHIGNFRTYVFEDLLRRTLKFVGFDVHQVMNITDVDDKTIRIALEKNVTLEEVTVPLTEAFFADLNTLNIEQVEHYPHATAFIPVMIEMIQNLLDKRVAYLGSDGSIYFSIARFPKYGRLSHLKLNELREGASDRVGSDEYDKDNAADFVLWKAYDESRDGKIYWESPFGKGRPGWHIECSAMAMSLLGETIDIHVGGVDNMFPHHENEIAQSECYSEKCFVKHWLHCEHLLVEGKKMSKSLGNFYTLRDLIEMGYSGEEVRYLLISTHYRVQLNFSIKNLDAARATLERLSDFIDRLKNVEGADQDALSPILEETRKAFTDSLCDDLNIAQSLAALFDFVRQVNHLCDEKKIGKGEAQTALAFLEDIDQVLGFIPFERKEEAPAELLKALEKRQQARQEKNWAEADAMRDLITEAGFMIEDTPHGPRLKKR